MTPTAGAQARHRDAASVMSVASLELRARVVVEGLLRGLHKSPFHGFSVEFSEYRPYTAGDDVRYLDWRLYARTDRDYIKRFEDETNLRATLVADRSRSMAFGSSAWTKWEYAATLAAALGALFVGQGDAVGLLTFGDRIDEPVPARNRPGQLRKLLGALDAPATGLSSNLNAALAYLSDHVNRRGLIILLSDLLTPLTQVDRNLGALRAAGHELIVLQVLDPSELQFEFEGAARFLDMESGKDLTIDPARARGDYLCALDDHQTRLRQLCGRLGIDYQLCRTDQDPGLTLRDLLTRRAATRRRR